MNTLDRFLESYQAIRRAEGWGARDGAYYENLPTVPADDPQRAIWQVRETSFRTLLQVLRDQARVLDVGAGNGWLAYQLAQRGHSVAAVDVNDDELDGLGARRNYPLALNAYRADFRALPFGAAAFDCVVFSASLHYAHELAPVIAEALRVLTRDGMLIVMDSPLYHDAASGRAMLAAKGRSARERFGVEIAPGTVGFLTFADLDQLASTCSLSWRYVEPYVNLRWNTRHLRARLRREREPARFGLLIGRRRLYGIVSLNPRG